MVISNQQWVGLQTAQKSGLGNQWNLVNTKQVHWKLYRYWWLLDCLRQCQIGLRSVQCLLLSLWLNIYKQSVQYGAEVPVFRNSILLQKNIKNSEIEVQVLKLTQPL